MRSEVLLFLLLLGSSLVQSVVAITVTVYTNFVCPVSQVAYLDASGVGGCGVPSITFSNPTFTRCPSFTYITTTVSITLGPTTVTSACSTFPAICPQGFNYVVAGLSGVLGIALTCNRINPAVGIDVATASCNRVGGTYLLGVCTLFSCSSTGCNANNQNCRLVTQGNSGSAAQPCTANGSICLNSNQASGYANYACGVPCNGLACYDNAPSVQVCDASANMCKICDSGARSNALTCSTAAITGSLSPQRRRDRILKEKRDKYERDHALCPPNRTPCPIGFARDGAYECLDLRSELESCGGCRSNGTGVDCSAIEGVRMGASTCTDGLCVVYACKPGWMLKFGKCFKSVVAIR